MPNTIRPGLETTLASKLADDFFFTRSNFYYFLGKTEPWVGSYPEVPLNTERDETSIRDNILYMKKINSSDISLTTNRYDWDENQVFDQWDHTIDMRDKMFYCVTPELNVYKCLDNKNNAISTHIPTETFLQPFRTSDGYLWKFMYTIQEFKEKKFLSDDFLPVQRAMSDVFYNNGSIEDVIIVDEGSNYIEGLMTTITVTGTVFGSGASVIIDSVDPFGRILNVGVLNGGSGYTAGILIEIDSPFGEGAIIEPTIVGGVLTNLEIVDTGFGYSTLDEMIAVVRAATVSPVISRDTGEIIDVIIDDPGKGYMIAPTLTINQYPETGTGKYGHPSAHLKAFIYEGSVVKCTIEDPGQNYPVAISTNITVTGDGIGAAFTPVVRNGQLVDVIVENGGMNYSYVNLAVTGAGSGASLTSTIRSSDLLSNQSLIEQAAIPGAIYSIKITVPGDHYTSSTVMTIEGDGIGAAGTVSIGTNGGIARIVMTSFGLGYTVASVSFSDANRESLPVYINAEAYVILPPMNGHGYDAVTELFGNTLAVYTTLSNGPELDALNQEFRQFGLIENPRYITNQKRYASITGFVVFKVVLNSLNDLNLDDTLVSNHKRYRVVFMDQISKIVTLQQLSSIYALPGAVFHKELNPLITYDTVSIVDVPDVNKYSGNILYAINKEPFESFAEQTFANRTYIRFSDKNI